MEKNNVHISIYNVFLNGVGGGLIRGEVSQLDENFNFNCQAVKSVIYIRSVRLIYFYCF